MWMRRWLLLYAALQSTPCHAADLPEIVSRATATLQSDWAADTGFAYVERDEVLKQGNPSSKTSQVVYVAGSDYYIPLAVNDQPFSPDRQKAELTKFRNEVQRRSAESPDARRARMAKYKKEHDENGSLLLEFPKAFTFQLLREETKNGHEAYVLAATPVKRTGSLSTVAKVLGGMHGTVWIDKETFHAIRAECDVVTAVPLYGSLARVLPGTHIALEMAPVTDTTWLIGEFSMTLSLSKVFIFRSNEVTKSTYSNYEPNEAVVSRLLNSGTP